MAEVTSVPAAAPAVEKKKPEKPDADLFNEQLAKAEKEYKDSFAKYVWLRIPQPRHPSSILMTTQERRQTEGRARRRRQE